MADAERAGVTGTGGPQGRFAGMDETRAIWLVNNSSSGSNDDDALQALERCCGEHGFHVAQRTTFPAQDLPTPAVLDAAEIGVAAVFAGDGTINALISALAGWRGAVLVLPGGTMNLLFHRLHGEDRTLEQVVADVAHDRYRLHRPGIVRSPVGDALAGVLAGPGTSWNQVREAMRDNAVIDLARNAAGAIAETVGGEMIACVEPKLGRPEGYPLIMLTPTEAGIELEAYHAETASDYLGQAWALAKRNFREGPHTLLGVVKHLRLASVSGDPFGLLIDGEPKDQAPQVEFSFAQCEVDLMMTAPDAG